MNIRSAIRPGAVFGPSILTALQRHNIVIDKLRAGARAAADNSTNHHDNLYWRTYIRTIDGFWCGRDDPNTAALALGDDPRSRSRRDAAHDVLAKIA